MNEYTELRGQEDVEVVPLRVHASEALFSSKTPGRKGVEHRTAWANCFYFQYLSSLVRKLERCLVRLPAWEAQCLKEKPLFFLCKLPWWLFFIAWECAGTLHYRQLFPKAWCLLLVGRHPSCSVWEIVRSLITISLSAPSAKVQDFCELCVECGCFEASACVSQILWGEGACIWICCLVNWGTGWGDMHVGKYFLCAFLSSRGFLTSVPVVYGAAQRSFTWVSSCEHTSEGPLKKKGGEIENRSNVSKVCWCSVEINHRQSESQAL